MNWFTVTVVFVITWWMVLFCTLPFGVRRAEAPETGQEPGAPERPRLLAKALVTTAITAAITGLIYVAIEGDWFSFRATTEPWIPPDAGADG